MSWDTLPDLLALHDRTSRRPRSGSAGWTPVVDLYETPDRYVVIAELPGLTSEDFSVSATATSVILTGTRRPLEVSPEHYLRLERGYGHFSRTFAFPEPIDTSAVSADFREGVLEIVLPKVSKPAPRRIRIE